MSGSEVSTSVVKCSCVNCSEDLSNMVSNIRGYIDYMKFAASGFSCITFVYILLFTFFVILYGCMTCMLPFNCVNYISLLSCLCILIVMHAVFCELWFIVLFCNCLCVNV
jgi:hypothetical protein